MRLARKLVFGLVFGIIAVLLVSAWLRVNRESDQFDSDMQRDVLFVGRAVAAGVKHIWRSDGQQAGFDFIESFSRSAGHVHVRWVWLTGPTTTRNQPMLPDADLHPVRAGQELSLISRPLGHALTYLPLTPPSGRAGALEVTEALDAARDYVRRSIWNAFLTTVVLLALAAVLASILGTYFVGRPVHLLVGKVRRIATGDLGTPLHLRRADELGELASAINQMCDAISTANESARREAAARLAAVEQLRHADRLTTVGKLASGIAHELGTPLNIVAGRAYMIAAREATGEEVFDNARIVMAQTERMTQIIRQLLDFARPRPVEKARIDLHGIAQQTAQLLRPMADRAGVRLELVDAAAPALAVVDPGQIQQVFTNLVVNSIHASNAGSAVTIGVRRQDAPPPVEHEGGRGPYVSVFVADQGHGMDAETKAHMFDPFFTTKDVGSGTGLGLSIAYGIVRDHGGWIDVESAPGQGTTVAIQLPADPGAGAG